MGGLAAYFLTAMALPSNTTSKHNVVIGILLNSIGSEKEQAGLYETLQYIYGLLLK